MNRKVVGLDEIEAHVFPWGQIKWLQSEAVSGAEELTAGEVIIKAGQANGVHAHPNCEEILVLVSGELLHTLGDEGPFELKPGMSIRIPRGVKHNARTTSDEDARMIVAYSSPRRETSEE